VTTVGLHLGPSFRILAAASTPDHAADGKTGSQISAIQWTVSAPGGMVRGKGPPEGSMAEPGSSNDALMEHAAFVRALARSLLKDDSAADDAVQETYVAALKSPPQQKGLIRPWLAKTVRNVVRQKWRSRSRRYRRERVAARPEATSAAAEIAAREEILRLVSNAVLALPETYRAVVLLKFYEGLPPRKIAAKLDLPVETVRTRVKRALALLRARLDEDHEGGRRGWQAAILPLAGPLFPVLTSVPASVALGAAVVGLCAAVGLLWWAAGEGATPPVDRLSREARAETEPPPDSAPAIPFGLRGVERTGHGAVSGRVMDLQTGRPVSGAFVALSASDGEAPPRGGTTRDDGRFDLRNVRAGRYRLRIDPERGEGPRLPVVCVRADEIADVGTLWVGRPGRLEGRVVDRVGTPIAGADVEVHPGELPFRDLMPAPDVLLDALDRPAVPTARTRTDAQGRFRLDDLAPGPFTLIVRRAGYRQAVRRLVMTADGIAGGPVAITLTWAMPWTGTVTDEDGTPVEGARVALAHRAMSQVDFFARQFTVTDAAGGFRFDTPPRPGELVLAVATPSRATFFTFPRGRPRHLAVTLPRGATIRVRAIETGTERPLAGARLAVILGDAQGPGRISEGHAAVVRTDADGEAIVHAVPGRIQMAVLRHRDCGSRVYVPNAPAIPGLLVLEGTEDGRIEDGPNSWLLRAESGQVVSGRVTDADGAPIPGAECSLMQPTGMGDPVLTDEEGRFTLPGSIGGMVMVIVRAAGHVQDPASMRPLGGPAGGSRDIRMSRAVRLEGRVVDEEGRPLPGAEVRVVPDGGMGPFPAIVAASATVTNARGRYVLDGLSPGARMSVAAWRRGHVVGSSATVTAGDGADVPDLVLRRGSRLQVRVESEDGRPVEGATVMVLVAGASGASQGLGIGTDPEGRAALTTDEDGLTEIVDLPDGEVHVAASRHGFATARRTIAVRREAPGSEPEVIRLAPGAKLRGRVLDVAGKPVASATVLVLPGTPDRAGDVRDLLPAPGGDGALTDGDGRFVLEGLSGDRALRLRVMAAGFEPRKLLAEPGPDELVVRLRPGEDPAVLALTRATERARDIHQRLLEAQDEETRQALSRQLRDLMASIAAQMASEMR
jgi:RNA polymerase sigma factor (sigma-70 family)